MARKKEFDPEKALTKALNLFWLNGYDATSVDDLCNEMGIKRGSLYDTYGNKHSLFIKSLQKYVINMYKNYSTAIQTESGIEAINAMFTFFAEESLNDAEQKGCFLVNSITELSALDPEIRTFGIEQSKNFEQFFFDLLVKAKNNGEINSSLDLMSSAQFLVNSFFGLRVSGKINPNREFMENIIAMTISVLY